MRTNGAVVVAALLLFVVAEVGGVAGVSSRGEPISASIADSSLGRVNFLVGVAQLGAQQENATRCGRELELLLKAVARKEFWSLKVLDSFGAPPKSFSWGNLHWFASQRQCIDLNSPYAVAFSPAYLHTYRINPFNITSPFPLRLTMLYMRFATPHYIDLRLPYESFIHIGLCLPQSCSVSAVQRYTDEYFRRGDFLMQRDFELQLQSVAARAPSFSLDFFKQTGTIISITIITTLLLLICLAEIVHRSKEKLELQQLLHTKAPNVAPTKADGCMGTANVSLEQRNERTCTTKSSTLEELLLCFRLVENCRRALQPERPNSNSNFLSVIAGVRTIICLWVSTFHVYYYSVFALSNAPMMFAVLANFLNQPLLQAVVFVDVFFIMSALLLVYNFLSAEAKLKTIRQNNFVQNTKLFGRRVLHRYLRLTPMLIVTMLLSDIFYDLINTYSPFYLGVNSGYDCKQRWWHNLLYVQNFLDMRDICCSWTWYLACEMQFYILITALLFLYAKSESLAKIVFVTFTLGFATIGWLCNYSNGITFDLDVLHSTLNQLYVKPWVRINPYLGGAFCGWLLHHHGQRRRQHHLQSQQQPLQQQQQQQQQQAPQQQPHYPQRQQKSEMAASATVDSKSTNDDASIGRWHAAFWLFIGIVYAVANFMSYWRSTPTWLVATIMSFGKLLFALCIGGGILMCAWGYGGRLNALLSAHLFRLLNKFCFSIYLLTPVITMVAYGLRNEPTNFNEIASATDFIAVNVLAVLCSFLAYVLVELPVQRMCNRLLHKRR
ncbi:PREDICTED: nose resistant to fluoxetine protein 6-like [Rhagoletis zephyria]|uniref:nose resistant to fluoxetine protein 6-like n=1 Tax=Rhagoletis zephyria TaxID=28612 RepID=UPI0008114BB4|nr:PREDICTED: nose resistant to fluoxetine protein 6-like [Rhagoletis zephyria]